MRLVTQNGQILNHAQKTLIYHRRVCMAVRGVVSVFEPVDLRPLLGHAAAAAMLLLARGQLNRAFRRHGLLPPDPLPAGNSSRVDLAELDDPAAVGIEQARARHGAAFVIWTERMPLELAHPVLDILRQTHQALEQQRHNGGAASAAVLKAHEFLSGCLPPDEGGRMAPGRRWPPAGGAEPAAIMSA